MEIKARKILTTSLRTSLSGTTQYKGKYDPFSFSTFNIQDFSIQVIQKELLLLCTKLSLSVSQDQN